MAFHVRAMAAGDEAAVLAMTEAAFSREPDEAAAYAAAWATHPGAGPDSVRVGVAGDGEIVATLTVIRRATQVGAARLPTACIRDVTTLKVHRGQGYGARMVRETLDGLAAEGYTLALLDGIKDFYGRFGFAPVVPFVALELDRATLADLPAGTGRVRRATPDDAPALLRLYTNAWGGYVGSLARDEATWRWLLGYHPQPLWVLEGNGGALLAYAHAYTGGNNLLDEWVARDGSAGLRLLRGLVRGGRWDRGPLRIVGPADYPLFRAVERRLPYEYEIYGHPDGGWMALVLDPAAAFAALLPELGARWTAQRRPRTALRLVLDDGSEIGLLLHREGVTLDRVPRNAATAELPRRALAPLLYGARSITELAAERGTRVPPAGRTILQTLFPARPPWLPGMDWF